MKHKLITILVLILSSIQVWAQNDLKARIQFEEAEEAFAAGDYQTAATKALETERLLGKWSHKISYIIIISLNKTMPFEPDKEILKTLRSQVNQYMKFAGSNKSIVPIEKFKDAYAVEEIIKHQEQRIKDKSDPDFLKGLELFEKNGPDKGMSHFQKTADKGNAAALCMLGNIYYDKGEYEKAMVSYQHAANKGNVYAMYCVGALYNYGHGVVQDYSEAFKWSKKAADLGCTSAMSYLGSMYYRGQGVTKNLSESLLWYERAALKDDPMAISTVGAFYYSGTGVTKDEKKAEALLKKGARKNDKSAMRLLGDISYNRDDYKNAVTWYEMAAEKDDIQAMLSLAKLYKESKISNPDEMIKWYTKAAEKGDSYAMGMLHYILRYGEYGVKKDKKLAKEWEAKEKEAKANGKK